MFINILHSLLSSDSSIPNITCRLISKKHMVVSLQLRNNYLEDSGEEYVPTSDEEEDEEEKEEREESNSDSLGGSTGGASSPPPLPPRTLAGEESSTDDKDDSTFLRQAPGDIRLEVSQELHNILQSIGNRTQHNIIMDDRDKNSSDEKVNQPVTEVPPLSSSNDYIHQPQQSSEPKEEEYEIVHVTECRSQSSEHIYQPLIPLRLDVASESGPDGDYQTLQR